MDTQAALDRAHGAWPAIARDDATFVAFLEERVPEGSSFGEAVDALHVEDLYLAWGCSRGDRAALSGFDERVLDGVAPAVARIDRSAELADELRHELRVKLLVRDGEQEPRIVRYLGRGPLRSWVQVAAIRAACDRKRRGGKEDPLDERLLETPFLDDPELRLLRDESRALLKRTLDEGLRSLSVRDRNVLRLYLVEELPSEAIGKMYRVHRGTVARWIAGAHELLLSHVKRSLLREKGLGPEQLESMLRLAGSQLSISLSILLRK